MFPRGRLHMFSITADSAGSNTGSESGSSNKASEVGSSAHANVCTLGMSAVSLLLQGCVSAVKAHWLRHNILFGQMHLNN